MPLVETDSPWLVNKEYHRSECVLEYAVCGSCRDELTASLSEDSKEEVRRFLEAEIEWEDWLNRTMMMHDVTRRFDSCIACQAPREKIDGYGVSAYFDPGGALVTGPLPLLMCRSCIDRMTASLSPESREVWTRFQSEYLGESPGDSAFPGLL